ncbi:MAG: hypothetical protein HDR04_06880 [Lachnospiraceae bacterium]|nr:hypothetical protein [Lachnospiraceae bacterium]
MGRKDLTGKSFFADPERFAELMNVMLYHGETIVKPQNLVQINREYPAPLKNGEKRRDILVKDILHGICYGLELETESDYSMPERVMVYDICEWETQIQEINKQREKKSYRDKKSRIRESSKLLPVITVVLYLGTDHWQGKKRLSELFHVSERMRELLGGRIPDYSFQIAEADYVDAAAYRTDLREFFHALQCRRDKKNLKTLLQTESFHNLKEETAWVIAAYLDRERLTAKMKKEGMDMCQALEELLEDKRLEGKQEGRIEGNSAGRKEERMSIIGLMLREGLDKSLISRITRCTEQELAVAARCPDTI